MYNFVFNKETYEIVKHIEKLDIEGYLVRIKVYYEKNYIGEIEAYYFDIRKNTYNWEKDYINSFTKEQECWYKENDIDLYDYDEFIKYIDRSRAKFNNLSDFTINCNNEIYEEIIVDIQYLIEYSDLLYIHNYKFRKKVNIDKVLKDLRQTLYMIFNYKSFIIYSQEIKFLEVDPKEIEETFTDKYCKELRETLENNMEQFSNVLLRFMKATNIEYIDNRPKGGALWILKGNYIKYLEIILENYNITLNYTLKGGRASRGKPAWYIK